MKWVDLYNNNYSPIQLEQNKNFGHKEKLGILMGDMDENKLAREAVTDLKRETWP